MQRNMSISKAAGYFSMRLSGDSAHRLRADSAFAAWDLEVTVAGARAFEIGRDDARAEAMRKLRELKIPLPPGFVFDREEANAR